MVDVRVYRRAHEAKVAFLSREAKVWAASNIELKYLTGDNVITIQIDLIDEFIEELERASLRVI